MTGYTAEPREGKGGERSYTVADGVGILKHKLLTLSDPRTAAEVSDTAATYGYAFAGVSAMEKEASDGATTISAFTEGIFDMISSGAIVAGQLVFSCGAGQVKAVVGTDMLGLVSGALVGKALETASAEERIQVKLGGFV